jgi:hypothetical protein
MAIQRGGLHRALTRVSGMLVALRATKPSSDTALFRINRRCASPLIL